MIVLQGWPMNRVQGGLLKFHELCHFFKKIGQEIPRKEQEIPRKWQEITGRPFWGRCK
jgi:hypothetical protein